MTGQADVSSAAEKSVMAFVNLMRRAVRRTGFDFVRLRPDGVPLGTDPADEETVRAVRPYTMTSPERIVGLCEAVRYLVRSRIEGDLVECGVWRGGSTMAMARTLLQLDDTSRTLFLYDTFEGMTPPDGRDVDGSGAIAADLLAAATRDPESRLWCLAGREDVERAVVSTGYPQTRLRFVEGRVEDTIPATVPQRIALLRLDTDWYASTSHELKHLFPRLVTGGVLVIDDYGHWQGARLAVDEFIEQTKTRLFLHRVDYTGRVAVKVSE